MRERQEELDRLGAVVFGVTFEPPPAVARLARREALPYPTLSDPTRRAYAAFGLRQGRFARIWNWSTLKAYVRGMLRGRWPRVPRGDIAQLGGDVVIDPSGHIVFVYRSREAADRPSIEEILAAVGTSGRKA